MNAWVEFCKKQLPTYLLSRNSLLNFADIFLAGSMSCQGFKRQTTALKTAPKACGTIICVPTCCARLKTSPRYTATNKSKTKSYKSPAGSNGPPMLVPNEGSILSGRLSYLGRWSTKVRSRASTGRSAQAAAKATARVEQTTCCPPPFGLDFQLPTRLKSEELCPLLSMKVFMGMQGSGGSLHSS